MAGLKINPKAPKPVEYGFSTEAVRLTAEAMNVSFEEAETMMKKLDDKEKTKVRNNRKN